VSPSGHRRELSRRLRIAVASAGGAAAGMSLNELVAYVLEHGLPGAAEREQIQLERDAREGDNTTTFSSPG